MLTREIIQRVREIQVRTGRPVADVLAGGYVSVFKGRGVEFDEVRPYIPGDDVRTIDWNVTARTGEPHVKRYVEERQLTLMLLADVSASQDFGSALRSKREAAAELCALLAFSAIRNDDNVGLTLFHGDIEQYIPPRKGQKHALRVVREVLAHGLDETSSEPARKSGRWPWTRGRPPAAGKRERPPRRRTDIGRALRFLMSVTTRRSVCFLVSDFQDDGFEDALRMARRKHDVVAVWIYDPRERSLPAVGLLEVEDAETGESHWIDTASKRVRDDFERAAAERVKTLETRLAKAGIDLVQVDVSQPVIDPLIRFFRMRERRQRR